MFGSIDGAQTSTAGPSDPFGAKQQSGTENVINAKFSDRDILTVNLTADALLSSCWGKACEFARNFGAPQVSLHHLLLGASHVRDAESALEAVCDDLERLSHQLADRCARRSFAKAPETNRFYEADKQLKVLLCEAAALAAEKEAPNLSLSLVIEAVDNHQPRLPIVELLSRLSERHATVEEAARFRAEQTELLRAMAVDLQNLQTKIDCSASAPTNHALDGIPSQIQGISSAVVDTHRKLHMLTTMLFEQSAGSLSGLEGQPQLRLATAQQVRALTQELTNVPARTVELLNSQQTQVSEEDASQEPAEAVLQAAPRPWYRFGF